MAIYGELEEYSTSLGIQECLNGESFGVDEL